MANIISCRTGVFSSLDEAFKRLPEAGLQNAEVGVKTDVDFSALAGQARDAGMTIRTTATGVELGNADSVAAFNTVIDGTASIGTKLVFVSVKGAEGVARPRLTDELRGLAHKAESLGLVLCMETHPPFGTNAAVALETIEAVNSPALRYNFDTANIYYYNEGMDTCVELEKAKSVVASVHLKESRGEPKSSDFPVFGEGVVDFPKVFEILDGAGFTGPCTIELEGSCVKGKDDDGRHEVLKACMAYLKSIGAA